jgi:hypothetical protein
MDGLIDLARQPALAPEIAMRSPARARLADAIAALALAEAELAAAQERAMRLAAIIAEASGQEIHLAALTAAEERHLGDWLTGGGSDPRPEPNPAIAAAEQRNKALAADAAAARTALPAAEQSFQRCAAKVRDLQRRRDEAVCAAAVDAARDFAAQYRAALTTALEHEAILHGLRTELLRCGNRADRLPGALEAAAGVGKVIDDSKRIALVRHAPQAGQRLLTALVTDSGAQLRKDGGQ